MRRADNGITHTFKPGDRAITRSRRNGTYSGVVTSITPKGVHIYPDYPILDNRNQIDRHITFSMAQNVLLVTGTPAQASYEAQAERQMHQTGTNGGWTVTLGYPGVQRHPGRVAHPKGGNATRRPRKSRRMATPTQRPRLP